jgi:RNA recognition motif-containing protein
MSDVAMEEESVKESPMPSTATEAPQDKYSTQLFVGNLNLEGSLEDLKKLFSPYGKVTYANHCGRFGFISMATKEETDVAIQKLNSKEVNGKMLVVEKVKPKVSAARNSRDFSVKLFVTGVKDITEEQIKRSFEKYGKVVSVEKHKLKKQIAFVRMDSYFSARKVIENCSQKKLPDTDEQIFVQLSFENKVGGQSLSALAEQGNTLKLFVGSLYEGTTEDELAKLFEQYGPVHESIIVKGKDFGFIKMLSLEHAENAVRGLNRRDFKGRLLKVTFSNKNGDLITRNGTLSMMPRVRGAAMRGSRDAPSQMRQNERSFWPLNMNMDVDIRSRFNSPPRVSRDLFREEQWRGMESRDRLRTSYQVRNRSPLSPQRIGSLSYHQNLLEGLTDSPSRSCRDLFQDEQRRLRTSYHNRDRSPLSPPRRESLSHFQKSPGASTDLESPVRTSRDLFNDEHRRMESRDDRFRKSYQFRDRSPSSPPRRGSMSHLKMSPKGLTDIDLPLSQYRRFPQSSNDNLLGNFSSNAEFSNSFDSRKRSPETFRHGNTVSRVRGVSFGDGAVINDESDGHPVSETAYPVSMPNPDSQFSVRNISRNFKSGMSVPPKMKNWNL